MPADALVSVIVKIEAALSQNRTPFYDRLRHSVAILARYFKVNRCSLMLINPVDMTLEVKAATNPAIVGMKRRLSDVTIATRALLEDAPFHANKKRLSYFIPPDGSRYVSSYSLSVPIKYNGKKLGVLNFTDLKAARRLTKTQEQAAVTIGRHMAVYLYAAQADELLEKKVKKYESAMAQLIKADEMKTSLTGFIVHDLKGPISTIMANLDMLSYEPLAVPQSELVNLALNDAHRMQRMVMNILDVLKMEEGKIAILREETDIYELAQREIASFKALLAMRNISVLLEGEPHTLFIDENLIGRTVSNLLINAIEHSPDGKTITVAVDYDKRRRETALSVIDQGTGIPEEFKDRIFDKFFQVEGGRSFRKTTTGLGLTFCKLVIDAHGGEVRVRNNGGGGTCFTITLPETIKEVKV